MWMVSSPVRRFGGKAKSASRILEHFTEHREYVEPYFGAGSVFFAKDPAKLETVNDLDSAVTNFFSVLRDRFEDFQRLAALTPYSREIYYDCRATWQSETDALMRAWKWWVVSLQSFGGGDFNATGWRKLADAKTRTSVAVEICRKVEGLAAVVDRIKYVQIENAPALKVIRQYATKTSLCYCDPPYYPDTRASSSKYAFEMSAEDHKELVETLLETPGKIVLSGYDNQTYAKLEASGWTVVRWSTGDSTARSDASRLKRQECLWISP